MNLLEAYTRGVASTHNAMRERDLRRLVKDAELAVEGKTAVHVSELGRCSIYLWAQLSGTLKKDNPHYWKDRALFLRDGFVHEEATLDMLWGEAPDMERNLTVPPYPVSGTDLVIVGECDAANPKPEEGYEWVVEHKAVKEERFELYKLSPDTIPPWYVSQLCAYITMLDADHGMLIFKNRHTSALYPEPASPVAAPPFFFTSAEARLQFTDDVARLKKVANGEVDIANPTWTDECTFCPRKNKCFPHTDTGGERKVLDVTEKDKSGIADVVEEIVLHESKRKEHELRSKMFKAQLLTFMLETGVTNVAAVHGKATLVTRSGSVRPVKKDVDKLIASGELRTYETSGSQYIQVRPVEVKLDGKDNQ